MTTTVLNTNISEVKNKIWDTSSLVTTAVLNTKIREVENKIPVHAEYITTQQFSKLTAENFKERLRFKKTDLANKTDFDNKLIRFDIKITSNKTKYLEVRNKLNSITTKDYNFFLGRMYFTSDGGSQNMLFMNHHLIH